MKTDEELLKNAQMRIDGNIIFIDVSVKKMSKEEYNRQAELSKKVAFETFAKNPDKIYNFIVDVTMGDKDIDFPKESSAAHSEIAEHQQVNKVAIISTKALMRGLINFVTQISGRAARFKFFANKEEALLWINEKDV